MTQDELKQWLHYDPLTGVFTWLKANSNRVFVGRVAGSVRKNTGYVMIHINKKFYYGHRLAWLYVHGYFPASYMDHIDGNPNNNRIENLREATPTQNNWNRRVSPKSTTGLKGVWRVKSGFAAYIATGSKRKSLGIFDTPEEAHQAYLRAAAKSRGEFLCTR